MYILSTVVAGERGWRGEMAWQIPIFVCKNGFKQVFLTCSRVEINNRIFEKLNLNLIIQFAEKVT